MSSSSMLRAAHLLLLVAAGALGGACRIKERVAGADASVASAPASAAPSPSFFPAPPSATPAPAPDARVRCVAMKGDARYVVDLDPASALGTFTIDGPAVRRFDVRGDTVKGLTLVNLRGYRTGDRRPAGEKLAPGRSRLVALVPDDENPDVIGSLYFEGDYLPPGVARLEQIPCTR